MILLVYLTIKVAMTTMIHQRPKAKATISLLHQRSKVSKYVIHQRLKGTMNVE